jgi:hypothetical protein
MIQPIKQVKWRSLVSEQKESGQSIAAFCRTRELRKCQFYYWKKRLREVARPSFVEMQVAKPHLRTSHSHAGVASTIEVRLSNGRSLMVAPEFDPTHLRALLAIVESGS